MNVRAIPFDDLYSSNKFVPFSAALGFHIFLLMWNPIILKAGAYQMAAQVINVKMMDHLPVMEQPKPQPKPVEKKVEKKHVKKAKKAAYP